MRCNLWTEEKEEEQTLLLCSLDFKEERKRLEHTLCVPPAEGETANGTASIPHNSCALLGCRNYVKVTAQKTISAEHLSSKRDKPFTKIFKMDPSTRKFVPTTYSQRAESLALIGLHACQEIKLTTIPTCTRLQARGRQSASFVLL